ncbi:MAG: UvrD-helicase domain-containing protein [Bacteroidales bacterium]|nr:UvrD-helicase domain-containing protein [Bacteroidales bacterium]
MAIRQDQQHPLNIYRASAGSGKTHLLTGFYLKLIFSPQLLPETHSGELRFNEILAVTFTNKATGEMKSRIIDQLYLLSQDPDSSDYFDDIAPSFAKGNFTDTAEHQRIVDAIREKATHLLVQILNEYSSFNISTIDSFFQRIVRSFARELNIPGNYEVELDADHVLEAAVTNFLDKLSRKDNPSLFNWMVRFSEKRIEEGSGWDFRDSLISLAKKVLGSETYRQHSDAIHAFTSDKERLVQYARMLDQLVSDWRKTAIDLGEKGRQLIERNGLQNSDFAWNGSGTISYFDKLINGSSEQPNVRFVNCAEDADKLFKRKDVPQLVKDDFQELMMLCIIHTTGDTYMNYLTARAIQSNFYELGIIANIDKEVTAYCNEQNIMLLSSTTEMLARLIEKDDAPFIYEKTGTRIHSYMIDEFQDTSVMQWGNFKPLLSNSIAQLYQNLIVGDVKQSIYRWRGGDWNLLNSEINDYESWAHHDDSTSLTTNWRSLPAIVEFNNDFFEELASKLDQLIGSDRIRAIYADVRQHIAPPKLGDNKPQGLVNISFLEPKDDNGLPIDSPHVDDYIAEASRQLPLVIIELQKKGYRPSDIVILCRRNKECSWVAEALLRYKNEHPDCPYCMDIISGEALLVAVRPTIQALIHLMTHLQTPDSDIFRAIAWCSFFQLDNCTPEDAIGRYFALDESKRVFHPELAHRPLYEMTEELIALLPEKACQEDAPFLQAFRDLVLEFVQTKGSDLSAFLNWWLQTGCKKSITTPAEQDAILIMSVHKSKGLGKPAVILPYASWNLDLDPRVGDIIWCEPKVAPFKVEFSNSSSSNILLPIPLKSELEKTIFEKDYKEERERVVIDNLNTAYVAFTRAKEILIVMAPKSKKAEGTDLKDWLQKYCATQGNPNGLVLGDWPRQASSPIEIPTLSKSSTSTLSTSRASANRTPHLPNLTILHDPAKPDITAKEKGSYIHAVMQEIRTAEKASQVIRDLYSRGAIDETIITEPQMQQTIARILAIPEVAPWFQPGLQVLNELTLMDPQGRQQRPDRIVITPDGQVVVIDYKTGSNHPGYRKQLARYMYLLRQLGYKSVQGFLLFFKDESVIEIK